MIAGDPGQGEHATLELLVLLDHHHALMLLPKDHTRPLVPRKRQRGVAAGALRGSLNKEFCNKNLRNCCVLDLV